MTWLAIANITMAVMALILSVASLIIDRRVKRINQQIQERIARLSK